jgi:hypothetical protein
MFDDLYLNTDLLCPDGERVACRVRRNYSDPGRYLNRPTIRSYNRGHRTELTKLLEGHGDYLLYGHAALDSRPRMRAWVLIRLSVFRRWWSNSIKANGKPPGWETDNRDGTKFWSFSTLQLPNSAIADIHGMQRPLPRNDWLAWNEDHWAIYARAE